MDQLYKYIGKNALFALVGIFVIAVIYSISPKIGLALSVLLIIVGLANMYEKGVIKPAKQQ